VNEGGDQVPTIHTRNGKVIQCHAMEVRVGLVLLIPPLNGIDNIFRFCAEVQAEFIDEGS